MQPVWAGSSGDDFCPLPCQEAQAAVVPPAGLLFLPRCPSSVLGWGDVRDVNQGTESEALTGKSGRGSLNVCPTW